MSDTVLTDRIAQGVLGKTRVPHFFRIFFLADFFVVADFLNRSANVSNLTQSSETRNQRIFLPVFGVLFYKQCIFVLYMVFEISV